jgi:hypothetical protein
VDFRDPRQRDAYYDGLLADTRMREAEDPATASNPNLIPACSRFVPGAPTPQRAFPSRRMIKVAKELGENALVQSICQDDFTPAIDAVLSRIGAIIRNECR